MIQVTDATADGGKNHLWLVDVQTNAARQLTYSPDNDKRGEYDGEWMPDGRSILFLAHRGEYTQLYQLPIDGGEAHPFAVKIAPPVDESKAPDAIPPAPKTADGAGPTKAEPLECSVGGYSVSPDGKEIAIIVHDPQTPGEKKEQDEKADAVLVNHDPHGSRLYLLDPANGKITPTAVPPDVAGVVWTRHGDRMLAIAEGMNDVGDLAPAGTAWVVTVADPAHPQQLKAIPATIEAAIWSQDEKHIDYLAQSQTDAPPGYTDLYEYAVTDQSARDLSAGFSGSVGLGEPIAQGDSVLEEAELGTRTTVLRFTGDRREELKFDTTTVSQLSTNVQQTAWVWLGSSSTQPPTLYYAEKPGQNAKALKTPDLLPTAWTPIPSHVISWKSDAFTIEGLLYLPPQASAEHKVPLIVEVHGGPTGAFDDSWSAFTEFMVGQGWAVLRPNPRGSTGYGAAFAAANKNDMGGGDYRDIMAGVDAVLAHYPIDPNKMGLMGYSYGGEMAAFVEGRTDRFKAIISMAPVTDQESEYGTERGSYYDRWFYGGYPWEHAESAWRQSALADAAKAKTPFLLLQGESDSTDPLGQSEEMYRALRQMGVTVELAEYPREDHGPLYEGIFGLPNPEPWHGFDGRQRIVTFIDKAFGQ
ncbi:MAG TPA: prolyl oligopeptidase family serine peptidase [Candidatus Acidoferrales bacterium]|nr:prolyl oligopeptidase family serine peptidase [Candidatus Acidoferrales bacterium]